MSIMASRLFIQSFIQAQIKETSKLRVTVLYVGNPSVDSVFQEPVTQRMFPFDDVIMSLSNLIEVRSETYLTAHIGELFVVPCGLSKYTKWVLNLIFSE